MARSSALTASSLLLIAGAFGSVMGCHLLAGIEEKMPLVGGGGGMGGEAAVASSSSSSSSGSMGGGGSGGAATGGGGGAGGGSELPVGEPAVCAPGGVPLFTGCDMNVCMTPGTPFDMSPCHCGECDHHCGGLTCSNSLCSTMIMTAAPGYVYGLTTNGKDLFFASFVEPPGEWPTSTIWRVSLHAQNLDQATLMGTTDGRVKVLTADCNDVYFAAIGDSSDPMKILPPKIRHYRAEAVFSDPIHEVLTASPPAGVDYMVVDGAYLYWVDNMAPGGKHEVWAWRKQDEVALPVYQSSAPIRGLALKGGYLYWIESGTATADQKIRRTATPPMPGLPWEVVDVATNTGDAVAFAVDDTSTYWIDASGGMPTIKRGPKSFNPNATYIPMSYVTDPGGSLIVDDNYVYFMQNASQPAEIWRVNKNVNEVTPPTPVVLSLNTAYLATQVIAEPERLYWTSVDSTKSHVVRVAK